MQRVRAQWREGRTSHSVLFSSSCVSSRSLSGSYNIIDNGGVQYILDSMIEMLLANSSRKFSQTEQAFFQRWYAEQTAATQQAVQGLVQAGQIEFINGGWSDTRQTGRAEWTASRSVRFLLLTVVMRSFCSGACTTKPQRTSST